MENPRSLFSCAALLRLSPTALPLSFYYSSAVRRRNCNTALAAAGTLALLLPAAFIYISQKHQTTYAAIPRPLFKVALQGHHHNARRFFASTPSDCNALFWLLFGSSLDRLLKLLARFFRTPLRTYIRRCTNGSGTLGILRVLL